MKKCGHKSKESSFNGVSMYLQNNFNSLIKGGNTNQQFKKVRILCTSFLKENNISASSTRRDAIIVQQNWDLFKNWIKEQ